jgi:hypothetical protein
MRVTTITPLRSHLSLATGVTEASDRYRALRAALLEQADRWSLDVPTDDQGMAFRELDHDGLDCRLFSLPIACEDAAGRVHVYPDDIAVAEITFPEPELHDDLADEVQRRSEELIGEFIAATLTPLCRELARAVGPRVLVFDAAAASNERDLRWCARTLVLADEELAQPDIQTFLRHWLAGTLRPEDADDILADPTRHRITMRWLNYVLVEARPHDLDHAIETMCLAQYFYAAQELNNRQLYETISGTFASEDTRRREAVLARVRTRNRLHMVRFSVVRERLQRRKKALLDEILSAWEYDELLNNAERMLEICATRIADIQQRRSDRSSFYTDMILVAIGFIAIIDLTLSLSQYSREAMLRPALGYLDGGLSSILTAIAAVQTDWLLASGAVLTLLLLGIYLYVKKM